MQYILTISQVIISIGLIITILFQRRGAGGSGIFGSGGGTSYYTKRGFEKILFTTSIVLASLFIITAFLNLII
ncbi:MAG: preprotein translocase subunit SecG [Parcubacteria group bacterium]|nr:preprotein translocase subunit SecG [Parcubacteria group bacterium]